MNYNPIYVTQPDAEKIRELLREAVRSGYRGSDYIQKLKDELERAHIISPQEAGPDLITLNARALLLDTQTGETMELTLVTPEQADISRGKISILAPIGAAMLGYRVGDTFEWDTPGGKRTLRVEKLIGEA